MIEDIEEPLNRSELGDRLPESVVYIYIFSSPFYCCKYVSSSTVLCLLFADFHFLYEQTPVNCVERDLFQEGLNVDAQGPSLKRKSLLELNVAKCNELTPAWILFRMMIPTPSVGWVDRCNRRIKHSYGQENDYNVKVDFYAAGGGFGIVMVSAKKDSRRSTVHAVEVFREIYYLFYPVLRIFEGKRLIRLLVPAAHTKRLIALHTIRSPSSKLAIYITDNVSFLSSGDVIVEVQEDQSMDENKIMESVFSDLGELTVDESMVSEIKATNGIHPSKHVISACGKTPSGVKVRRGFEVKASQLIPLSYIDYIIGKDGSNVDNIRESSPASVFIRISTLKEVTISIVGETRHEVEVAATVMEDMIPKHLKKDGKPVFDALVYSSSDDERDGWLNIPALAPNKQDTIRSLYYFESRIGDAN
ncbi:unnamed protein product [Cuscuta campestris]|uniref:K Homology domain-containing protein n=1 Tax=Cuscuta campestris TaxID=132261 RepID=A0A484LW85_9ASTE|nr:unnamed protein product [Cuscuta campestris]